MEEMAILTNANWKQITTCLGEIASGSKVGIDATKKLSGEGFDRPWPPLNKMDESVKAKVEKLFNLH
jgi:3-polyprenyl-4-hydroxybenzoate decarboxylase